MINFVFKKDLATLVHLSQTDGNISIQKTKFMAALLTIAPNWKQSRSSSISKLLNHSMTKPWNCSTLGSSELLICITWINNKDVTLSEKANFLYKAFL